MGSDERAVSALTGRGIGVTAQGAIDIAGGASHAELAGAAAGIVSIVRLKLRFSGLVTGGGNGEFGKQEVVDAC